MRGRKKMSWKVMGIIALLAGFLGRDSNAGFEQFAGPVGEMNVYDNVSGTQGGWLWWSNWGLADLQSITTNNRTFKLLPNVNTYNETDAYWSASGDGNKWMEASTLFKVETIAADMISAHFSFNVDAFDLDSRYALRGFVRVLDPDTDFTTVRIAEWKIASTGSTNLSISLVGLGGMVLHAGWQMNGLNANPSTHWGSATITATALAVDIGDGTPPTPNPMTFATAPYALSDQAISMTAATATDTSGVEYYFTCTTAGGHDSGWQTSTTYVDTGLAANTTYSYTVKARDLSTSQNTTAASIPASATTIPADGTKPSPDPMTFSAAPLASPISVKLTATTATDASAVQYYFSCTSGGGHDSGWQSSPVYIDTGLAPSSNYTYAVQARDLSAATNTTAVSTPAVSVSTASPVRWMINPLMGYTGDSTLGATRFALALDSLEVTSNSTTRIVSFNGSGAAFGVGVDYTGRNVLRTIGQNYGDRSFEAFVTIVLNGTGDQAAYMGMGQGIVGAYGVPDLSLQGVSAVNAEIKATATKMWRHENGVPGDEHLQEVATPVGTHRLKLAYDADAETATITLDVNYNGTFVADRTIGTVSTTNLWGGPVRVYIGGGQGLVFKDLSIVDADPGPVQVAISGPVGGGGMVLSWDGSAGQTYEVQYKTDLVNAPSWTTEGADMFATASGTMSATSTVSAAAVFYQVISK